MRNKNLIVALVTIFSLICIYQLYWTFNQFNLEKTVKGLETKKVEYDLQKSDPNFERTEQWNTDYDNLLKRVSGKKKQLRTARRNSFSLGLDLQGGMFVTLEVGVDDLVRKLATTKDDKFEQAIQKAIVAKETSQSSFVDLFYAEVKELHKNDNTFKFANYFIDKELDIGYDTSDDKVKEKLNAEAKSAINRTFKIIRTRIDQFGVSSPNLQLQENAGRILLELPGVKDQKRVRELLRSTAKLEFWVCAPAKEGLDALTAANEAYKKYKATIKPVEADSLNASNDTTKQDSGETAIAGDPAPAEVNPDPAQPELNLDNNLNLNPDAAPAVSGAAAEGDTTKDTNAVAAVDTSKKDSTQLSEEEQYKQFIADYPLFEFLQILQQYPDENNPLMGMARKEDTAMVNSIFRIPEVDAAIPDNIKFLWGAKPVKGTDDVFELIAIKNTRSGEPPLDGGAVEQAQQDFSSKGGGGALVTMQMNADGAQKWGKLTTNNVDKHIAIALDDLVYSYPVVNGPITGGNSQITGNFSVEEAQDLANLLKAGKLPVKTVIIGEDIVGPTLGEENISNGLISFFVAIGATIIFMFFYYNRSGLVANLALIANVLFILGVSAAFNVVFTLPGIAAVVLTMGMAVDANVLIFERVREEQSLGKSLKAAITAGFKNAFSSIIDASITTLLTGVILFAFGVGPIKGFAVSLMIGIVTSLISALFITRLILDYSAQRGKSSMNFGNKLTLGAFKKVNVNMVGRKKIFYGMSGLLVGLSLVSIIAFGFKTGVDFKGGRQYKVEYDGSIDQNKLTNDLKDQFEGNSPVVKTITSGQAGERKKIMITTSFKSSSDKGDEVEAALMKGFNANHSGVKPKIVQSTSVGPAVAKDIKVSAIYSVIFSLLVIFLYILIRFRKWQYSLGALTSLFHDVIVVLGIFSILGYLDILPFSLEIDQAFIAAILTIVGYSINDTVVVFDRIRENHGEMKSSGVSDIYNTSINQTISRTLITSVTTFITALILFLMGGETVKGFIFALLLGIFFGTYSSIFVASPVAHDLIKAGEKKKGASKS